MPCVCLSHAQCLVVLSSQDFVRQRFFFFPSFSNFDIMLRMFLPKIPIGISWGVEDLL